MSVKVEVNVTQHTSTVDPNKPYSVIVLYI